MSLNEEERRRAGKGRALDVNQGQEIDVPEGNSSNGGLQRCLRGNGRGASVWMTIGETKALREIKSVDQAALRSVFLAFVEMTALGDTDDLWADIAERAGVTESVAMTAYAAFITEGLVHPRDYDGVIVIGVFG
jgi:hypothetical protein